MTGTRSKREDLAEKAKSRGFTPSARDYEGLVELLGDDDEETWENAERALLRLEPAVSVLEKVIASAKAAPPKTRARLVRLAGKFDQPEVTTPFLLEVLGDAEPKARRNAIIALGKVKGDAVEEALLRAWDKEESAPHRRSLVASLGKVGTARSLPALSGDFASDPELARIAQKSRLMIERTISREDETPRGINPEVAAPVPLRVVLRCRLGLEGLLCAELGDEMEPRALGPGRVGATLRGPMTDLFRSRTMVDFAFPVADEWMGDGEDEGHAAVRALTSDEARRIFSTWTIGPIRYRIAWGGGGHKRAVVWRAAKEIAERAPDMINDPTESTWEATVRTTRRHVHVELAPRALVDPRFAYRKELVAAGSHPTIAAALVQVGGVDPNDVVWDPFVGSGTELVERALAGKCKRLIGTDTDASALASAKQNLAAANVFAELAIGDATSYVVEGVTLILTNPPMGRRVVHHAELGALLDGFIDHAAKVLAPGGRVVWLSPNPDRTAARAASAGFAVDRVTRVDMGGFDAELQVFRMRTAVFSGVQKGTKRGRTIL